MNSPTKLETISWEMAWEKLHALLPNVAFFTPESLLTAAKNAGMHVDILEPRQIASDENDLPVLCNLFANLPQEEPVILVTDRSFFKGATPFVVRPSQCEAFSNAYQLSTGEHVISGADAVLVCPQSKLLMVCHHEGTVAVVKCVVTKP